MPAVRRNSGLCDPGAQKFLILGHHLLRKIALCIVTYNSIYTELEGKENENVATTVKWLSAAMIGRSIFVKEKFLIFYLHNFARAFRTFLK